MGKNLKGRECGKGIYQRKDGKYFARYCARDGKRQGMYFDTLPEARNWRADAIYEDKHGVVVTNTDMTVDEWFKFWTETLFVTLRLTPFGTIRNGINTAFNLLSGKCVCQM